MNIDIIHILKSFFFIALFGTSSCPSHNTEKEPVTEIKESVPVKIQTRENKMKEMLYRIDSTNNILDWKKLNCGLYLNKEKEIGLQISFGTEVGATTSYITHLCCDEESKSIKSVIDTTTFKYLGSTFYKDKRNIYHYYDMAYGGRFFIYKGVDYKTFRVVGDSYAKDKNHIYGERAGVLENVDYKTFTSLKGAGPYAKDKNGYYFWNELIYTKKELKDSIKKPLVKEFYDLLRSKKLIK